MQSKKRKEYLDKCGDRERWLRGKIQEVKQDIRYAKNVLTNEGEELFWFERAGFYRTVNFRTKILGILRHELNRLKGWDRCVVPRVSYTSERSGQFLVRHEHCCCGNELFGEVYCPWCGRKILWKKVK